MPSIPHITEGMRAALCATIVLCILLYTWGYDPLVQTTDTAMLHGLLIILSKLSCRSEPSDDHNNKRKRFSDEQLQALTDLAEEANWSLLSVAKEAREQFCSKNEISKVCISILPAPNKQPSLPIWTT